MVVDLSEIGFLVIVDCFLHSCLVVLPEGSARMVERVVWYNRQKKLWELSLLSRMF